jgi:glucosamine--fructose-6-phosphate aminotransferase (isomerizing)
MCGIVGAVAQRNIVPVLVEGLRRLEYRGYDSCGVAVLSHGEPRRARSVARVADLDAQVRDSRLEGVTGIAHTRWATHGAPVTDNAHPIFSRDAVALVHNGIIENYESLREMLRGKGYEFVSQTDTEVIAHLIHSMYRGDLFQTVRDAVKQLHGAYAIAVIHKDQPHTVVGARQGSPLVVGVGEGENFLASDALALAGSTDRFAFLEEGDVVEITLDGVKIVDREGAPAQREVRVVAAYGGRIAISCRRRSSSSRARSPTRSRKPSSSIRCSSGPKRARRSARSTTC